MQIWVATHFGFRVRIRTSLEMKWKTLVKWNSRWFSLIKMWFYSIGLTGKWLTWTMFSSTNRSFWSYIQIQARKVNEIILKWKLPYFIHSHLKIWHHQKYLSHLRYCFLSNRLKGKFNIDAFFGRCFKVWNIVVFSAPFLSISSGNLSIKNHPLFKVNEFADEWIQK